VSARQQRQTDSVGVLLHDRLDDLLREQGADDVLVFRGGIIPEADIGPLKELGVAGIFTPGASMADITAWLEQALDARESATPTPQKGNS